VNRPLDRWRAYLLLAGGCLAGGLVGALFDQLTATISPEYFLEGKGLDVSSLPFRWAVAKVGFLGALPLGALITGAALIDSQSSPGFVWRGWLARLAWRVAATVAVCAVLMPTFDPFAVRAIGEWPSEVTSRLLACWGMHVGAYLGVLIAVLAELLRSPWGEGASRRAAWRSPR